VSSLLSLCARSCRVLQLSEPFAYHSLRFATAQGGVEGDESLLEAAQRELVEEAGPDMDIWATGRAPAGAYEYKFPKEFVKKNPGHDGARVSISFASPQPRAHRRASPFMCFEADLQLTYTGLLPSHAHHSRASQAQ
jgi:8-oxo-dGTP pyrophosphatase MutT (NUDIX family)